MVDLRSKVFNKVSGEVPLNYQFGALLGYSLETGPALVDAIHPEIKLDDGTELVALQSYSRLNETVDGSDYEVDIAFGDEDTLVGIESKRGDSLSSGQLKGELRVLEQNAKGRDVILLVITEDIRRPELVDQVDETTDHTVLWTSWYRIALNSLDQDSIDGYEPIQHMVRDLFDETGHTLSFEGFPDPALDSSVYIEWLQQFTNLMYDLEKVLHSGPLHLNRAAGQNLPSCSSKNTKKLEKSWYQPAAVALVVPYTADPKKSLNNYGRSPHVSLYGNYHDDEVGIFLNLNPKHDEFSETVLREHKDQLIEMTMAENMFFRISRNSHCNYNFSPQDLRTPEEISEFIENRAGTNDGKRVMIGRTLAEKGTPRETVAMFATEIEFFHDRFFHQGKILGQYREEQRA